MKVVLNAIIAKKNGGGATQIVLNYLNATLNDKDVDWYYIVSEEFAGILEGNVTITSDHWLVLPRQPQVKTYLKARKAIKVFLDAVQPDIVYSILAPSYFGFKYTEVMRCCNAWDVIERSDEAFTFLDRNTLMRFRLKTWLVRYLMKKADYFITQTQVAKDGIVRVTGKAKDNVAVIPNVLPRYYLSIMPKKRTTENIDILYVASPSPHKNLEILPKVAHILKYEYKLNNFRFLVTIPSKAEGVSNQINEEAKALSVEEHVINVGGKPQKDLVDLYETATVGFFPSVLETFSATLLEYMYFKLPIVSSDKPFNREVVGDAALFFDATEPKQAAAALNQVLTDKKLREELAKRGMRQIQAYLDYDSHYKSTIDFFEKIVKQHTL